MIIGIDGNEANVQRKVGISEYAYQLLCEFARYQMEDLHFEVYLKHPPRAEMPSPTPFFSYRVFGPKKLWTQFALPIALTFRRSKLDVFFTPSHYAPRFSHIPTVIAIMDVSYLHFPQLFTTKDLYQLKNWTAYSVKKASRVLTISNSSKDDILKEYHLPKEKVAVTYPGLKTSVTLEPMVYGMEQLKMKYNIPDDYFLFVGTLQPRKNIVRLIEAYSLSIKKYPKKNIGLVIVGKKGWQYDEILQAPEKFQVSDRVKFLDFVTDDELSVLYSHARAYVLPSLYEGFGLPILEAFQHSCPVITSNRSSMPEAGGKGALYVDPESTEEIASAMQKLIDDKNLRTELVKHGNEQLKKFSWEKTAKDTLSVLKEVANGAR